ncbi:hypothetical protein Taro_053597 [Colocasia esculenta]|uniref:CCHC-type domain-containing protein n=1 Tax=Colocasia esculenta TaxID=4460 RepID=A0A843XLL2_COLES|nr:hypothetical protein [Colocasia esculenta]
MVSQHRGACVERGGSIHSYEKGPTGFGSSFEVGISYALPDPGGLGAPRDRTVHRDISRGVGPVGCDLIATRLTVVIRVAVATQFFVTTGFAVTPPCPIAIRLVASLHSVTEGDTFVAVSWQRCQEALLRVRVCLSLAGHVVCYKPAVQHGFIVLPRLFARCSALEGLSPAWDTEDGRSSTRCRLVSPLSHCLSLRWFRSHVVVSGVRPQLGQAAVLHVLCVSMAALSRPCVGAEAGARLASRACGLRVPLLAASGGGLVVVVVIVPVLLVVPAQFPRYHSSVLGCQSAVAPTCMTSQPCGVSGVRGGSACGPSTLWRSEVAVLALVVVASCFPTALAGEGLVIPTGLCSRGSPVYFLQLGARGHGSSVLDGLQRRLWRRVVVISSESECCVRLPYMVRWSFRMKDACRQVLVRCVWSSSAHLGVRVPLRLRESACGVAFTSAGLLPVESVEDVLCAVLHRGLSAATLACGCVGLVLTGCELGCIVWLPCVLVRFPRTVVIVLNVALVVLVEDRPLSSLAEVLPRSALCSPEVEESQQSTARQPITPPGYRCYNCNQLGHLIRNCPYPREYGYGRGVQQKQQPQQFQQPQAGHGRGVPQQRGRGRVMAITRAQAEASNMIEAHPLEEKSCELVVEVRARRTFHDRRPVQSRAVAVQGRYLQLCTSSSNSVA